MKKKKIALTKRKTKQRYRFSAINDHPSRQHKSNVYFFRYPMVPQINMSFNLTQWYPKEMLFSMRKIKREENKIDNINLYPCWVTSIGWTLFLFSLEIHWILYVTISEKIYSTLKFIYWFIDLVNSVYLKSALRLK